MDEKTILSEKKTFPHATHCFVCGDQNPTSLRAELYLEDDTVKTVFRPSDLHVGFDGIVHGGIISALMDEAMFWAASVRVKRMCLTAELNVRFLHPVRAGGKYVVTAMASAEPKRLCETSAQMIDAEEQVYVKAQAKFAPLTEDESRRLASQLKYRGSDVRIHE